MNTEKVVQWSKAFFMICAGIALLLVGWSSTIKVIDDEGYTRSALTGEYCYLDGCGFIEAASAPTAEDQAAAIQRATRVATAAAEAAARSAAP